MHTNIANKWMKRAGTVPEDPSVVKPEANRGIDIISDLALSLESWPASDIHSHAGA